MPALSGKRIDDSERRTAGNTLLVALGTFALFRGALFLFDYIGVRLVAGAGTCRPQWQVFGPGHEFLNGFFRWDAAFYRHIALTGYSGGTKLEIIPSVAAFYPLFPYLARALAPLFGSVNVAGLVVTNAACVGALYYLHRLGDSFFSRSTTDRAATFLLLFPTSFFLSAYYTEGLYLFLSTAALYAFYREKYVRCGFLGGLSLLTRSSGTMLFIAVAMDLAWRLYRRELRFRISMLGLLLIPCGLGVFMVILKYQVGDPLAFAHVTIRWGRHASQPFAALVDAFRPLEPGLPLAFGAAQRVLDASVAIGFLAIAVMMVVHRFPVAFCAIVFGGVLFPLSTYNLDSMGRYTLVLFPAFYWLAFVTENRVRLERFVLVTFSFFLAIYSLRFMTCGWAG